MAAATKAKAPMLTAGATAAGLAGGLLLGSRARSKRRGVAAFLSREELEKTTRRSPIEVVLDGLTHRRGAHKREG
jgi:hypothetical protein